MKSLSGFITASASWTLEGAALPSYGITRRDGRERLDAHFRSFVQDLRRANINTYNERYEENEPARILSFKEELSYCPIDLIKALRSISYNIDDQSVNGCSTLLENLINYVMWQYISELPEYQRSTAW